MPWMLAAGAVAGLASGAIGAAQASSAQNAAQQAAQQAVQQYLDVAIPDPNEQKLALQQYQMTGQMDPRLAHAFQQAQSSMSQIQTDPALRQAQMNALSSLQNEGDQGGHTLQQDAYLNQVQQQVNAENRGRQGAIEQQFAERGMGQPGGLSLAAEEMNNQNMTGQENQASMQAAAQAQQNALQSLQAAGNMAGQQQQQQFQQQAAIAQAKDSINQFNTQLAQGVENQNVAQQNAANAYNVQERQNLANQNVGLANYQQQYNNQLLQQQFQNRLARAGGAAAAQENQAGQFNQQAAQNANTWGNIGQGLTKAGASVAQWQGSGRQPAQPGMQTTQGPGSTSGWAGSDENEFSNVA